MTKLEALENKSIYILREAYANFKNLGLLWSIGKDSTVLIWLARKAFFGHVPFPLIHVDTQFKFPEMIAWRNRLAREWNLKLLVGKNETALSEGYSFASGKLDRMTCCKVLKTEGLKMTLNGSTPRYLLNNATGEFENFADRSPFTGVLLGIRADEEGTRAKERYFSPRDQKSQWNVAAQPPEFWNQYKTEFAPGTHVRIHPLLDWTELDIWEYIQSENIPVLPLYLNQGNGTRYRSVGCYPCTAPVQSTATSVEQIVAELSTGKFSRIAERSGRAQDKDDGGTLETLRLDGYM